LLFSLAISLLVIIFVPPVSQDQKYHSFVDQRKILGITHFWNVVTNIPFLIIGIIGFFKIHKPNLTGILPDLIRAYSAFFMGLVLIGLGSGYYHLNPSNSTLVGDRMAITITFMSFFVLIFGESISTKTASRLLVPLIFLGLASVFYWNISENLGKGDLRFYALVQFLPMILIPVMLLVCGSCLSGRRLINAIILVYGAAKVVEIYDDKIYELIGFSGHSLKHLIAAFGAFIFLKGLELRKPIN
tara:strand:+ start:3277 stop:4008 length:732 start_codon:yes stop_codon:yes gene_type:complete